MRESAAALVSSASDARRVEAILETLGFVSLVRVESCVDLRLVGADLLVADLSELPVQRWRGIRALRQRMAEGTLVVMLSPGLEAEAPAILAEGADAIVAAAELERALAVSILAVRRGQVVAPYDSLRAPARKPLSGRQDEILVEVLSGRTNAEIADRLGLAEGTVKKHVSGVFRKLGVRSRTDVLGASLPKGAHLPSPRHAWRPEYRPLSPIADRYPVTPARQEGSRIAAGLELTNARPVEG